MLLLSAWHPQLCSPLLSACLRGGCCFSAQASRLNPALARLPLRSLMALFQQQEKGLFHWHPCVSNTAQAPGNDRFQLPVTLCPQLSLSAVLSPLSRGPAGLQVRLSSEADAPSAPPALLPLPFCSLGSLGPRPVSTMVLVRPEMVLDVSSRDE